MAGHSKWNNIKRTKGKTDALRAKIFTKIGRAIAVAVRQGGPDPNNNLRLKEAIAKAQSANMPSDNIKRGIQKASGELSPNKFEENIYEGYGIGGIAVIVLTLSDNKNRTAANVRHIFDKFGAGLGSSNSVLFSFDKLGVLAIEKEGLIEDEVIEAALEAGCSDFLSFEEHFEIRVARESFFMAKSALEEKGYKFIQSEIAFIPKNFVSVTDSERFERLLSELENDDDVQEIYHNGQ